MSKFMGLLKNEYIKQLKKKSTLFIFVLVAVFAFGLAGLVKLTLLIDGDLDETKSRFTSYNYTDEIEAAKENKNDKHLEYLTYLQDNKINITNWKVELAQVKFDEELYSKTSLAYRASEGYDGDIKTLYGGFIENNDWKGYYEFLKTRIDNEDLIWAIDYRLDKDIAPEENSYADDADWRNSVLDTYVECMMQKEASFSDQQKQAYEDEALTAKYRLENDITVNIAGSSLTEMVSEDGGAQYETGGIEKQTLWNSFTSSTSVVSFIGMLIIVIAGGIIASEFSNGTIKFLLINPRTRGKILISKYVTVISIGYIMMILCYIFSLISSIIFFGTSDMGAMYIKTSAGVTKAVSGFTYIFEQYMLSSVYVVVMATFAFAISSVVKSSSLAIGLGIFAMSMGENAVQILKMAFNVDAGRYTIFANSNLQTIAQGQTLFPGQTLGFAIAVIVIHMAVFLLTAWDGFVRRDV
ncbi:ABC transporter permease [Ruminococcus sp. NK3A76]|uniref:ABC transporter permease n=1 Tax=Ruminococcus sp. NK3A76 TaxID=877411 RepID=UPI00068A53B7|nr:ABC transporter permease [Ruminococcus sp. NK3A76]